MQAVTHIVSIILSPELHEAISLMRIGNTVLWEIDIDCNGTRDHWWTQLTFMRRSHSLHEDQSHIANCMRAWCKGSDSMHRHEADIPTGPVWMKSSQTSSSESCSQATQKGQHTEPIQTLDLFWCGQYLSIQVSNVDSGLLIPVLCVLANEIGTNTRCNTPACCSRHRHGCLPDQLQDLKSLAELPRLLFTESHRQGTSAKLLWLD